MTKLFAPLLAYGLSISAALATGESICRAVDGSDAEFGFGFGHVPGLVIVSATIRAEGQHWSIVEAEGAIPIRIAQAARDGSRTIIDFVDPQFNEILASVRIMTGTEGDDYRSVGLLRIPDVGVFALICE